MTVNYEKYMQSDLWRAFRRWALTFYNNKCFLCYATESLEVHHWTYKRLGMERINDVCVVCTDCHNEIHRALSDNFDRDAIAMKLIEKAEMVRPYSRSVADRIEQRIERLLDQRAFVIFCKSRKLYSERDF